MKVKPGFIAFPLTDMETQAMLDRETLAARIKAAIEGSDHSQVAIANEFGVTEQAVSGWIRTGKIDPRKLPKLAALTGRPLNYFMPGSDVAYPLHTPSKQPAIVREPTAQYGDWHDVTGYSQAAGLGSGAEAQEYAETHSLKFKASSLRKRGILNHPLAIFYGQGDSMNPTIKDGDAIMFDASDTRPVDGALYVVQVESAANPEYYVKRAEVLDGIVFFRSDNPTGDHHWQKPRRMDSKKEPITIIGRVHWIGGWAD